MIMAAGTVANPIWTAAVSCVAAMWAGAAGVAGGSLYLPILNFIGREDLKTASRFSAFMSTASALASVLYTLFIKNNKKQIDYNVALVAEPALLIGVSAGVLCNVIFPEWLVAAVLTLLLAFSGYWAVRKGLQRWQKGQRVGVLLEHGVSPADEISNELPWREFGTLGVIWICFFAMHTFVSSEGSLIKLQPCGVAYWIVTLLQIPVAIFITVLLLSNERRKQDIQALQILKTNPASTDPAIQQSSALLYILPLASLGAGFFSGLLGLSGGILLNPFFQYILRPEERAASTTVLVVLFPVSMSMVQYVMLGMSDIGEALVFATICFISSVIGLSIRDKVKEMLGRSTPIIIFMLAGIVILAAISIGGSGAYDTWIQIKNGEYMGFKSLC